jgi:serine/threonine protein phosphatase PrpC
LLKRYLWAIGQGIEACQLGDVLADRYLVVRQQILLDTKPGMPPETPQEIPKGITSYLRLSPYALHIPQVYGRVRLIQGSYHSDIWLLEDAPIYTGTTVGATESAEDQGQLLPELSTLWKDASGVRQLNWLWQLANLWQPLSSEGVAASLLTPGLIRVEGSVVRLLELQSNTNQVPTLQQLGELWTQLLPDTSPVISGFVQQLCAQMIEGELRTSDDLVALLDQGLKDVGRSQSRAYQIFTCTDKGPSRNHNEDACYPSSGQVLRPSGKASTLAIVCDGIGGHEGGEVASRLAIDTLRERVEKLPSLPDNWNPSLLTQELEQAACSANDVISQQNDNEHRSDRQRMGTTLVMARTCAHEIYITHVGDSRVYWVTRHNCHQVTQDDDLASREVRLGYTLYRNAVQNPTSGSLVQALGMAPSATLHPTVQRFVLDEDCVFLLCSDGLSDHDRVEQYWQTELLPILDGQIDLKTAGTRLINIANTQNGHDNATVALVYCQVSSSKESRQTQLSLPQLESLPTDSAKGVPKTIISAAPSQMKTQQLPSAPSGGRPWGLLLRIFLLLGIGGVLGYLLIPGLSDAVDPWIKKIAFNSSPDPTPLPASPPPTANPEPSSPSPSPTASPLEQLLIKISKDVPLVVERKSSPQNESVVSIVPAGSILQVINKLPPQKPDSWLLKVCSPSVNNSNPQPAKPAKASPKSPQSKVGASPAVPKPPLDNNPRVKQGDEGWIKEAIVVPLIDSNFTPTAAQQSLCTTPAPSASPSPSPSSTPVPIQSPSSNTPKQNS